jgi:hypothetical protein
MSRIITRSPACARGHLRQRLLHVLARGAAAVDGEAGIGGLLAQVGDVVGGEPHLLLGRAHHRGRELMVGLGVLGLAAEADDDHEMALLGRGGRGPGQHQGEREERGAALHANPRRLR